MSQLQSGILPHNRSSISQKSPSQNLSDTSELTDSELIKQVNELKYQVKILTLENELFEQTIMRLEPALMNGVYQALEYASRFHSDTSSVAGSMTKSRLSGVDLSTGASKMFMSPSRVSAALKRRSSANLQGTTIYGIGTRINVLERAELVSKQIQVLLLNFEKTKKKAARTQAILEAELEEIGIRVADVDKAVADFQQQVIIEGWDKIAQRIPAEIWIRFMTEWVKTIDIRIGKLRLRTSSLNTQYRKLTTQIRVKAELREHLRPVDFDKLEIENTACQAVIAEKMQQLEELKQLTGYSNLSLSIHKKAMMAQNNYLSKVRNKTKYRKEQTVHINKEREAVKTHADALAQKIDEIHKIKQTYEVPDVMDYVAVKSELTDLKHSVKLLENRLHIAQIAVSSIAKKLQSVHMLSKLESKKILYG